MELILDGARCHYESRPTQAFPTGHSFSSQIDSSRFSNAGAAVFDAINHFDGKEKVHVSEGKNIAPNENALL